ncbi:MAG: sugar phosphate isomerase/epimerase [Clostridia bacterium]|nr:sugar phosphate isomerase/epimerase [Clostridia bacterium]
MTDPKIYLAVDNCFASKRWTEPAEWMDVIKSLGLYYVEASADTECDPLYMGEDYMKRWEDKIASASEKTGVRVANLYSGHGTYATLGLAHTDPEVRSRFLNEWLKPMAKTASAIGAGLGFFCHAFSDSVLQDPERYAEFKNNLYRDLAELAAYARDAGCTPIGVEQMYSPHQIPWTVNGAAELIHEVSEKAGAPFYITVDVGHQSGQRRFVRPSREDIASALIRKLGGDKCPSLWLGQQKAFDIFDCASDADDYTVDAIVRSTDGYDYMFADYDDGDTYRWLSELGCYSPIVHLQQTDGVSSAHLPFTAECNAKGIIAGEKVLSSISKAYSLPDDPGMPAKPDKIFLTLEMFTGTSAINRTQLQKMAETVEYWREFIPEDSKRLSELN